MADTDSTVWPRGLRKRGRYWFFDKTVRGVRHRGSLGRATPSTAILRFHNKLERLSIGTAPILPLTNPPLPNWNEKVFADGWLDRIYRTCRYKAKARGILFHLTINELQEIAISSGGCCQVTGLPFSFERQPGQRIAPYRPSIDRINSNGWYSHDNCRLVCAATNAALSDFGDEAFHHIAVAYALKMLLTEQSRLMAARLLGTAQF